VADATRAIRECLQVTKEADWGATAQRYYKLWNLTKCEGIAEGKHVVYRKIQVPYLQTPASHYNIDLCSRLFVMRGGLLQLWTWATQGEIVISVSGI
jgi:hypothetical protein